jgi:hypothetical protein
VSRSSRRTPRTSDSTALNTTVVHLPGEI